MKIIILIAALAAAVATLCSLRPAAPKSKWRMMADGIEQHVKSLTPAQREIFWQECRVRAAVAELADKQKSTEGNY